MPSHGDHRAANQSPHKRAALHNPLLPPGLKVFRCWPSPIPQCCWWLPWVPQAGLSWGQCGALPHVAQRLWRLGQWNSHSWHLGAVLCTAAPAPVLLPWAGPGWGRARGHPGQVPATASAVPVSTLSSLLSWADSPGYWGAPACDLPSNRTLWLRAPAVGSRRGWWWQPQSRDLWSTAGTLLCDREVEAAPAWPAGSRLEVQRFLECRNFSCPPV